MAAPESHGVLAALSNELADAVAQAGASVVTVDARRQHSASGIVWSDGNVVTADHVLEREDDIKVTLADGTKTTATIAGRDPGSDVAVLKLAGGNAKPATLAPADSVKVGHLVLALGRPGDSTMASFGVVSATGGTWRTARGGTIEGYIRADVSLYPGFSGGPLVDTQGRVVGLNSYYLARGQEIALPSQAVTAIVTALLSGGGSIRRAYLGVTSQPIRLPAAIQQGLGSDQETGLMIIGVEADSPADKGGILIGDVLVAIGGQRIADPDDLRNALGSSVVGKATAVTLVRGGKKQELSLTPGERS